MSNNSLLYHALIADALQQLEALLLETPSGTPEAAAMAVRALVGSGGKRLRPALLILVAHLCNAPLAQAHLLGAAIEMLHTATLIHDDLIDGARIRRGLETLNAAWSPAATVLAGDLAFARAALLVAQVEDARIMRRFAETLEAICSGELRQMFVGRGSLPTIAEYYERIFAKTASLFMFATESGACLGGCSEEMLGALARFGELLGLAFQIADDVLDFMGTEAQLGKPVGGDLRQGLVTLPVLRYLELHPDDDRVLRLLAEKDVALIPGLVADLRSSSAAEQAMGEAQGLVDEALALLAARFPVSPYREALEEIAHFAVQRRY